MYPMEKDGFLGAERNLLKSKGWTYKVGPIRMDIGILQIGSRGGKKYGISGIGFELCKTFE